MREGSLPEQHSDSDFEMKQALENRIVFCKRPWQLMLALLPLAALMLFGWALYLHDVDFDDEYEMEHYAVSHFFSSLSSDTMPQSGLAGGLPVAGATQDLVGPSASAVVSIWHQQLGMVASGVLVHPDGYVITTLHSVMNPDQLQVKVASGSSTRLYKTEIVKKHPTHDLVLLKMVTNDRFLYLKLADSSNTALQSQLTSIGKDAQGGVVASPGVLQQRGLVRQVGENSITHLMQTNAMLRWEQGGGAVVNPQAELVGVGLLLQGQGGEAEGFIVPAHVIRAHFQDVVDLSQKGGQQGTKKPATAPDTGLNGGQAAGAKGMAAAWWDNARQQVRQEKLAVANEMQQQSRQNTLLTQNVAAVTTQPVPGQQRVAHIGAPGDSVSLIDLEHDSSFDLGFYKLDAILGLIILGVVAGAVGTLVPMGGGIVAVAGMMLVFGYGVYMVRPVIYITNLFTYGLAALRQLFAGVVITRRIKELLPATIVGAVFGYFLGHNLYDHVIGYLLGGFALAMAVVVYFELRGDLDEPESYVRPVAKSQDERIDNFLLDSEEKEQRGGWATSPIMGGPLGILTGLLGVSGGVVEQFFQRKYAGLSAENARANAIVMVFWASLTATLVSLGYGVSIGSFEWQTPLTLAMILVPSTYGGGFLGYRFQQRTTVTQQRWTFIGIMGAVAAALLLLQ